MQGVYFLQSLKNQRRVEYKLKKLKNRNIIERIIDEGIIKLGQ